MLKKLNRTLPYFLNSVKLTWFSKEYLGPCSRMRRPSGFNKSDWIILSGMLAKSGRSKGGSAKIRLHFIEDCLMNLKTSERITITLLNSSVSKFFWIAATWNLSISTETICLQPSEANSYEIEPVPENRSRTSSSSKSKRFTRILKRASLAWSVVGLALKDLGKWILLPLCSPCTIRNETYL